MSCVSFYLLWVDSPRPESPAGTTGFSTFETLPEMLGTVKMGREPPFSKSSDSYSLNDRIRSVTYRSTSSEILIVDDVGNGENRPNSEEQRDNKTSPKGRLCRYTLND